MHVDARIQNSSLKKLICFLRELLYRRSQRNHLTSLLSRMLDYVPHFVQCRRVNFNLISHYKTVWVTLDHDASASSSQFQDVDTLCRLDMATQARNFFFQALQWAQGFNVRRPHGRNRSSMRRGCDMCRCARMHDLCRPCDRRCASSSHDQFNLGRPRGRTTRRR